MTARRDRAHCAPRFVSPRVSPRLDSTVRTPRRAVYHVLVLLAAVSAPLDAQAMGRLLHGTEGEFSRCRTDGAQAKFDGAGARYTVKGTCYVFESSNLVKDRDLPNPESKFENETLLYTVKWEAFGKYHPGMKLAEETVSILKVIRPDRPAQSIGKINAKMSCDQDPWRAQPKGGCRLTYFGQDQSLNFYDTNGLYPKSAPVPASSLLSAAQREGIEKQHQRFLAMHKKFKPGGEDTKMQKPGVEKSVIAASQAAKGTTALLNAPTILSPRGLVSKGRGTFKIAPSPYLNGTHAQVQLKWLNAPANARNERLDFYQYEVPMREITAAAGMPAPDSYLAPGSWELRVRVSQPKASEWSQPARFEYSAGLAARSATDLRTRGEGRAAQAAPGAGASSAQSGPAGARSSVAQPPASGIGAGGTELMRPK